MARTRRGRIPTPSCPDQGHGYPYRLLMLLFAVEGEAGELDSGADAEFAEDLA